MKMVNAVKKFDKGIATIAVCSLGAFCMWLTGGATGVGWAILGILLIWD